MSINSGTLRRFGRPNGSSGSTRTGFPRLRRIAGESIHIMRAAVTEAESPAMLYSMGKDSSDF